MGKLKLESKIPFFLIFKFLKHGNKWTLALIIFLMAIAFINLVFITSLFNGIISASNEQIIDTYTGHITIFPKDNQDYLENIDSTLTKIKSLEGVKAVSAQITVPANLKYKSIKGNWQILAINPDEEKEVTIVAQKMIAGSYLDPTDKDQIIIGRQISGGEGVEMNAFSFKTAKVGEKVTLELDGLSREFTIKGLFYTKFVDTDQRAFISQEALNEFLPDYKDKATNIIIRLEKKGEENLIVEQLKAAGVEGNIYTWKDINGLMKTITESFFTINVLLTTVGVLIAAITIFIVIYIDIMHRRQQIGVLRAIGIRPYLIRSTYVLQTVIYSLLGILLGTLLFFAILRPYFAAHPFELPIGDATLVVDYPDFVIRAETVILVAILSGLIPAFIVTRKKIIDAILGR